MPTEKRESWSKFYWSDWRGDPKLKLCSLAARGLWMEMLSIMHEAEPFGHLLVEGAVVTVTDLAAMVGRPLKEVKTAFTELEKWKVFSLTDEGVPFSRRMLRDRAKAERDRANGKKGGNPNFKSEDNQGVNPRANPQKPEARSQSPDARKDIQSDSSSQSVPDTARPGEPPLAAAPSHPRYGEVLKKVEALLNSPNLLVFGRVDVWLKSGADPEADIYPTLERLKPRWKGRHLDYFDDAIADAVAARTKPLGVGQGKGALFDPVAHVKALAEKGTTR